MASFFIDCESVHVWPAATDCPADIAGGFYKLLSPEEIARANRFRFEADRRAFVVAHGTRRVILSKYLRIAPGDIRFLYSDHGKPALAEPRRLKFNASNSGSLSLIAVTLDVEIGLDLERMEAAENLEELACRSFDREETQELRSLPPEQKLQAFYACWTRKEAFLKAIGAGLAAPLDSFRVAFRAGEAPRVVSCSRRMGAAADWNLHDLAVDSNYAAALAYRGRFRRVCIQPRIDPVRLSASGWPEPTAPAAYGEGTAAATGGLE